MSDWKVAAVGLLVLGVIVFAIGMKSASRITAKLASARRKNDLALAEAEEGTYDKVPDDTQRRKP